MGSKKLQVWLPALFSIVMVLGMLIGYQLKEKTGGSKFFSKTKRSSLQEVVDLINNKYVDPVSADSINQKVIDDLLAHLDPHSEYLPPVDLSEMDESIRGNFQGIGVEFQMFDDTVNVVNVIKDGPADKAGIVVGDKIVSVNDSIKIAGKKIKSDDIRKYLRGEGGSTVKVGFVRNGQLKSVAVKRGTISISTVDAAYIIAPQIGYIRLNKFGERTYEEFMENLEKLQKQGITKLILDLRGNGGGLVNEATDIADEFLEGNKTIVYTEGSHNPRHDYNTKREGLFEKGKLVVLADETSASASEILAGALQDWDRATIIGRRTFGKGLVQQIFNLSNGGGLKLTIAKYYTPLGRNIQKPYANKTKEQYEDDLVERMHNGELVQADTSTPKGKSYKTLGGHVVYGGGGITPDIFVGADTLKTDKEAIKLYYKNTLSNFVYNYYIQNKNYFSNYKTPTDLAKGFIPSEKEWQLLQYYSVKDSIQLKNINSKDKETILKRIQYMMARQIWRNEGYFEASNLADSTVLKALNILK